MNGLSQKRYLKLSPPTKEDQRSFRQRILDGLGMEEGQVRIPASALRSLYPLCEEAGWELTVSLGFDGFSWVVLNLEKGDTAGEHLGIAVDLGSTTVVLSLMDMNTGESLGKVSVFNRQIAHGQDILSRIFYSKDHPEALEELRLNTVKSIQEGMELLSGETGKKASKALSMVIAGNTAMIHFLVGMDAFSVFAAPYAVRADRTGFLAAGELGIPISGYVYCFPAKANYLGGDIISGLTAVGIQKKEKVNVFFDVGTNGELVVGNREFLVCGAGAAGPALEGEVVKTGMRAVDGAVDAVSMEDGSIRLHTIGEKPPIGICGSGIVDLVAELFLSGWIDFRGRYVEEASPWIQYDGEYEEYAVEYAPGLKFYQSDIEEFLRTKAAAYTMMEYILDAVGLTLDDVEGFYMAGAFGAHIRKESAVAIGMYPDVELGRIHQVGNSSLLGAEQMLLDRSLLREAEGILDLMEYVQFGAVDNFLQIMNAAMALPHMDLGRFPTVKKELLRRQTQKEKK